MSEITHYLYRIQPTRANMLSDGPTPAELDCVARHFTYLQELAGQGRLLLAGRTLNDDEKAFGITILKVDSEAAARDIMLRDPAVAEGAMRAELFPYRIAVFNAAAK